MSLEEDLRGGCGAVEEEGLDEGGRYPVATPKGGSWKTKKKELESLVF